MTHTDALHEEMKQNAPKGATHYTVFGGYCKRVTKIWYLYSPFSNEWRCTGTDNLNGLIEL